MDMASRQRLALAQRICPGTCAHSAAVERTAGLVHLTESTAVVSPSSSRGRAASRDPACSLPPGPQGESACTPSSQLDSVRACAKLTSALACPVRRSPPASPTGRRRDTTHGTHASRPSASGLVTGVCEHVTVPSKTQQLARARARRGAGRILPGSARARRPVRNGGRRRLLRAPLDLILRYLGASPPAYVRDTRVALTSRTRRL